MRAEGEFTRQEVYGEESRRSMTLARLDTHREQLKLRRERNREGTNREKAKVLGRALADESFRTMLEELGLARAEEAKTSASLRRCNTGTGKLTATGNMRKAEHDKASAVLGRVEDDYASVVEARCDEEWREQLFGIKGEGSYPYRALKGRLRRLIESYKDGELPGEIAHEEQRLEEHDLRIALMQLHLVPSKKLKQFALSLTPAQRTLLVRMHTEDYSPHPKTVAAKKSGEPFRVLIAAGLIVLNPNGGVSLVDIGRDVADWTTEYMDGEGLKRRLPAGPLSAIKELFSEDQREIMIAKGRAALADIRESGESNDRVELGLPGVSYSIIRSTEAIQWFLRILGAHRERRLKNPTVKKYKVPSFTPGRLVEEEIPVESVL